jgi:hypothetical protein
MAITAAIPTSTNSRVLIFDPPLPLVSR